MSLDPAGIEALSELLGRNTGSAGVRSVTQLSGGASRQTYAVEALPPTAVAAGTSGSGAYILQRELADEPRLPGGMADEADLVTAARLAGVPAPVVVGTNRDGAAALGHSFFVTERVPGETIARRILRDDRYGRARQVLPAQLGRALGSLHTGVDPADLPWLEETDEVAKYREAADELDLVSPAFELGFRWLEANRPAAEATTKTVVHGDFRLGNLIVDEDGLAAVIDWELGHLGDPMEDLGWVCVRAWRFGGPAPVAGVGDYEQLFDAYEEAAGHPVARSAVRWWEILGTLKWGIMCGMQANRHLSGDVPSVELVSIGPRMAEQEYDLLRLIGGEHLTGIAATGDEPSERAGAADPVLATGLAEGGGRPSASQLLDAVREFLVGDVVGGADRRVGFHARVAANAVAIVGRELALAGPAAERRRRRLAALGFDQERALASAIRAGQLDDRLDQVTGAVMASVLDRLAINNPRWIEPATG